MFPNIPKTFSSTAEFTRPANADVYAINDAVNNHATPANVVIMEFAGCARFQGSGGIIHKVKLTTDKKDDTSTYRMYLYSVAPAAASLAGDNTPFILAYANRAKRIGYVDLVPLATEDAAGSDSAESVTNNGGKLPLGFKCADTDTKLYGLMLTKSAQTPGNGQKYSVEITGIQD